MVQLVKPLRALVLALCIALLAGGCARQPDAVTVKDAVQQQLDAALGGQVLAITELRRAGSAPLAERDNRLVYFDARLTLARDYNFTHWDSHSVASLADVLGAGPQGIAGLKAEGNVAGDVIGVHGTAAFARADDRWKLIAQAPVPSNEAALPAAAVGSVVQPRAKEAPPPTAVELALARLQELVTSVLDTPHRSAAREAIVERELDKAYQQASARLARAAEVIVLAGGADGGAYAETMRALAARAQAAGVALDTLPSEGSVANIRLLAERRAQFAIVQNDIAAAAYAGKGRFAGVPQADLRAVASLFPEAVHLVTRAGAGIASVVDLRGKRVELGPEGSGTRANALAILAAHGVKVEALAAAGHSPLPQAAAALVDGKADALFATAHAPAPELQRLAARIALAWVPLGPGPDLLKSGLLPLTLPARTYAGQSAPLPTLTAVALLVTREDVLLAQVQAMRTLLAVRARAGEGAAVMQIGGAAPAAGVTIPAYGGEAPPAASTARATTAR